MMKAGGPVAAHVATWIVIVGLGAAPQATADPEGFRVLDESGYAGLDETGRSEYLEWAKTKHERDRECAEEAAALLTREEGWIDDTSDLLERLRGILDRTVARRDSLVEAGAARSEVGGTH